MISKLSTLIYIVFFSKILFAQENITYGDCSPIVGSVKGDMIIKCAPEDGEIILSYGLIKPAKITSLTPVDYRIIRHKDSLNIKPNIDAHSNFVDGFSFPILDIKISNNKNSNLTIDKAHFHVKKSVLDINPFLTENTFCSNDHITIHNTGYSEAKYLIVNFSIIPNRTNDEKDLNFHDKFEYSTNLSIAPDSYKKIKLNKYFRKEKVNIDNIEYEDRFIFNAYIEACATKGNPSHEKNKCTKSIIKKFEKLYSKLKMSEYMPKSKPYRIYTQHEKFFTEKKINYPSAIVYGNYVYNYYDYFSKKIKTKKSKFATEIDLLVGYECGDYMPESHNYTINLKDEGENYTVAQSLSQKTRPRDSDRFTMTIGSKKSSYHELELSLHSLEHGYLPPKKMNIYIPNYGNVGELAKNIYWATVKANPYLNIRNDSNLKGKIIGKIKNKSRIKIILSQNKDADESGHHWVRITHNGLEGYIYDKYIVYGEKQF